MHRSEGFTLIEVIIVGALIGILVAIGVPQLLRARLAANEAGSIAALRAVSSSEANYATTCGNGGYATDLADLVKPSPASGHGFLSPDLAVNGITKSGYILAVAKNADAATTDVLLPTCNGAAAPRASSFYANAVPVSPGATGTRFFATDTPGTIYFNIGAAIPNPIPNGAVALQ
jgi:prepilin-type N-terminal cleavage/methylation domain-containing protein